MISRPLPFFSDRLRLDADIHLPEDGEGPYPVLVAASGYQGQKIIHPERFARALTNRGYAVVAFDYRGFGLSEGERGRLVPQDQIADIRAAVDRLSAVPEVDNNRIGLLGWALGGGMVVAEAAEDERIKTVVAVNAIGDGARSIRAQHDENSWNSLLERIDADRAHRTTTGRSEITSPWDIVRLDLDGSTNEYVYDQLYRAPGFGSGVTLQSGELLLDFSPEKIVHRLEGRPLLIVHGDRNDLHKPEEAAALYDHACEPKKLVYLEDSGHTEWMFDDHPTFAQLVNLIDEFLADALARRAVVAS